LLCVTYLNIIEEEVRVSEVEDHLLHPEPQLNHRLGILRGAADNSILKILAHSSLFHLLICVISQML
jgi:hypothetical protein